MWVGPIADIDSEFRAIDKNGGGIILFDEFCDWAIKKNLDLEDDDDDIADFDGDATEAMKQTENQMEGKKSPSKAAKTKSGSTSPDKKTALGEILNY